MPLHRLALQVVTSFYTSVIKQKIGRGEIRGRLFLVFAGLLKLVASPNFLRNPDFVGVPSVPNLLLYNLIAAIAIIITSIIIIRVAIAAAVDAEAARCKASWAKAQTNVKAVSFCG